MSTPSNFGVARSPRRRETFYEMDPRSPLPPFSVAAPAFFASIFLFHATASSDFCYGIAPSDFCYGIVPLTGLLLEKYTGAKRVSQSSATKEREKAETRIRTFHPWRRMIKSSDLSFRPRRPTIFIYGPFLRPKKIEKHSPKASLPNFNKSESGFKVRRRSDFQTTGT